MKFIFTSLILFLSFNSEAQKVRSYSIANWKIADYEKYIQEAKGIVVVNFWATFCKPCLHELPDMIKICKKENITLMLVSVDTRSLFPRKLNLFVAKRKWNTPVAWLNETDADFFCPRVDERWSGSIPATVIVNKDNGKRFFVEGEMNENEFVNAIQEVR